MLLVRYFDSWPGRASVHRRPELVELFGAHHYDERFSSKSHEELYFRDFVDLPSRPHRVMPIADQGHLVSSMQRYALPA